MRLVVADEVNDVIFKLVCNIYENYKNLYDIILFIFFVFKIK